MQKTFKKTRLALALQMSLTTLGLAATLSTHAAGFTLTFENNLTPEATPLPFTGVTAFIPFNTNAEFRVMTPGGFVNDGQKDAIFGGEQWVFDNDGKLAGVVNTPASPGATAANNKAPITSAVAGFPICTTTVCPTLFQNSFFFGLPLNILAPVAGSIPGSVLGAANSNLDLSR